MQRLSLDLVQTRTEPDYSEQACEPRNTAIAPEAGVATRHSLQTQQKHSLYTLPSKPHCNCSLRLRLVRHVRTAIHRPRNKTQIRSAI